ncbi:MAG: hypothetical protein HFI33_12535 [Lachnospiraceae bacterium]|nr:hypothetical protein [Lachnospiraceae bacterium]
MKHYGRLLLFFFALLIGGGLGYLLLANFEPIKMVMFGIVCLILGEGFYQIDKRIPKK